MEEILSFSMNKQDSYKKICPCCNQEIEIPLHEYSTGFNFNYSILINSTKEFFDLVELCPKCGYTMLFDNGISDEMKKYIESEEYKGILNNPNIEFGLKKWILIAMLSEFDENYTEAGIEYMKAYDYLELKNMPLDKRLIEKAASCFFSAADENKSFIDAFLAVDAMRRDGNIEKASAFFNTVLETFNGELVDKLSWKEKMWLDLGETEKRFLDL